MIDDPKQPETPLEHPEGEVTASGEVSLEEAELETQGAEKSSSGNTLSAEAQGQQAEILAQQAQVIEALQMQVDSLKKQLGEATQQNEGLKTQSTRMAADFDNFRKRTQKEKEELELVAKRNTIAELLSVVDNFERARSQIKPGTEGEMALHKSYQGVYKNLVDCLKRLGVSAMRAEGQPFDPNYHEAMLREATDEYPEGTVIEQLVRGYLIGERVLRHAMVKVAAPKESESDNDSSPITSSENNSSLEESEKPS